MSQQPKPKSKTSFSNFKNVEVIGQGAFGTVYKGYYDKNNKAFAIKMVSKKKIAAQNMVQQMQNQIKIMFSLDHPNIIKLYEVLEEDDNIYLILELAEKGQLYARLMQKGRFDEQTTKMMVTDIIAALEYLHSRNPPIIHRDIKPQNMLLDKNDRIKMADFGWSNFSNKQRKTYCGTFDYLAPQMIDKSGHDQKLDIWCLGVLVYQLLTGKPPFAPLPGEVVPGQQNKILQENIQKVKINFPADFPVLAKDFVMGILRRDPKQRTPLKELKQHQWLIPKFTESLTPSLKPKNIENSSNSNNIQQLELRYKGIIAQLNKKNLQLKEQINNLVINSSTIPKQQQIATSNGTEQRKIKMLEESVTLYKNQIDKQHLELKKKDQEIFKLKNELKSCEQTKKSAERYQAERNKFQEKYKNLSADNEKLEQKFLELNKRYQDEKLQYQQKLRELRSGKGEIGSSKSINSEDFINQLQDSITELCKKFNQSKKFLQQIQKKQTISQEKEKELQQLKIERTSIRDEIRLELKQKYQDQMDALIEKARQELDTERRKWQSQRQQILNLVQKEQKNNPSKFPVEMKIQELQLQLKTTKETKGYLEKQLKVRENKIKDLQSRVKVLEPKKK